MKTDDYTQDLLKVMAAERTYSVPLETEERRHLFSLWIEANPDAVAEMEDWALGISGKGEPVAVQRLFERERWDGEAAIVPVPYTDRNGRPHRYSLNHNDRALFGRWLQAKHPDMRVRTRKSRFDGGAE